MINGGLEGFFPGKRGLNEGDLLSPFLFVLAKEVMSRKLVAMSKERIFSYHPKCHRTPLTHLCFADDLMIF